MAYRCKKAGWRKKTRRQKKIIRLEMIERARDRADLKRHIRALGLRSEDEYQAWHRKNTRDLDLWFKDEYQAWCRKNSRDRDLRFVGGYWDYEYWAWYRKNKSVRRQTELRFQKQLGSAPQRTHNPVNTIDAIHQLYDRTLPKKRIHPDAHCLWKIRDLFNAFPDNNNNPTRRAFHAILLRAARRTDLIRLDPVIPAFGAHPDNNFISGLAALARHSEDWVRPLAEWVPPRHNPRQQFHHLACHLLARYDVPTFMDAAFFTPMSEAGLHQAWFKHIGSGQNIRTVDLPVALSKKSAHCFLTAPDDLSIAHALRWGQVLGQGGSPQLAWAVIDSRLGESFANEDFWSTAILFFANNPMLDPAYVGPIVDYIRARKSAQPNFSLKGRSLPKLLRQVEEWHGALARRASVQYMSWHASGIGEFEMKEKDKQLGETLTWSVKELLSGHELWEEGRAMSHCVHTYAESCRNGWTSIWSLGVEDGDGWSSRILTIAVDPHNRTITQVRGRHNALPSTEDPSQRVLRQWMSRESLTKRY